MTLWAARAEFTDNYKGSIETGKYADFVVLNKNIIEIEESKFKRVKVKHTFIGGEKVH
jgi:predicted amidohydrolase YtcJ